MATKENTSVPQVPVGGERVFGAGVWAGSAGRGVEPRWLWLPLFLPTLATGPCWHDPGRQRLPVREELDPGAGVCSEGSTRWDWGAHT